MTLFKKIKDNHFVVNEIAFPPKDTDGDAIWIKASGTVIPVKPQNGTDFSADELRKYSNGGPFEFYYTKDGRMMVVNEFGQMKNMPLNRKAKELYINGHVYDILGDVLVCDRKYVK